MKRLILIRHAQAEHHIEKRIGGWASDGLTALGYRQAQALAARLKSEFGDTPCLLVSSDLVRALQTSECIGQALGVHPVQTPALRECSFGIVEGLPEDEARRHYIEPTEPLADWVVYPGAESWRQVRERVVHCIEHCMAGGHDLVLAVSHKVPIHLVVCWWLGLDLDHSPGVWFDIHPTGITALRVETWGGHTVECLNDTAHLYTGGLATPV